MRVTRITKIIRFEAAHALFKFQGPCRHIHGHSYELHVTVKGLPQDDPGGSEDGMLIEFSRLKKILQEEVIDPYDHSLMLNDQADNRWVPMMKEEGMKVVMFPFQPTSENLVIMLAEIIAARLPKAITLQQLKLFETSSSYAEWLADDNK